MTGEDLSDFVAQVRRHASPRGFLAVSFRLCYADPPVTQSPRAPALDLATPWAILLERSLTPFVLVTNVAARALHGVVERHTARLTVNQSHQLCPWTTKAVAKALRQRRRCVWLARTILIAQLAARGVSVLQTDLDVAVVRPGLEHIFMEVLAELRGGVSFAVSQEIDNRCLGKLFAGKSRTLCLSMGISFFRGDAKGAAMARALALQMAGWGRQGHVVPNLDDQMALKVIATGLCKLHWKHNRVRFALWNGSAASMDTHHWGILRPNQTGTPNCRRVLSEDVPVAALAADMFVRNRDATALPDRGRAIAVHGKGLFFDARLNPVPPMNTSDLKRQERCALPPGQVGLLGRRLM